MNLANKFIEILLRLQMYVQAYLGIFCLHMHLAMVLLDAPRKRVED